MFIYLKKIDNAFACKMIFFVVAFYVGLWTIRIPTIKDQVATDYLGIGYIFAAFSIGSVILMILSNKIIKNYTSKLIIKFCGYAHALVWIFAPLISNIFLFMILAFLAGCVVGIYEIAMNLQASDLEKKNNKSMMSGFHAFFSLGLLLGAITTSVFVELEISFLLNSLLVITVLLPLNILFANSLGDDLQTDFEKGKKNIFFLWPLIIFVLVFITITDSFTEGSVDAWAALYMRDYISTTGFKIGLATIFFNIFMVIGRLIGDKIRDILGVFNFLFILLIFSIFGLLIIFIFKSIYSSILGFSLLGIGISNLVPLAYSIAGKVKGIDSAVSISIISISAYGVFMVAPALLGLIANYYGVSFVFFPLIFLFLISLIILIFTKKIFN
tara:strand:- start:1771 stop:2925 length:1155 start_codon:yes stop_codon:yes gene_type:complete